MKSRKVLVTTFIVIVIVMISACGGRQSPNGNSNTDSRVSTNSSTSNPHDVAAMTRADCTNASTIKAWIDDQVNQEPGGQGHYKGDLNDHVTEPNGKLTFNVLGPDSNQKYTVEILGVLRSAPTPETPPHPDPQHPGQATHGKHTARLYFEQIIEALTASPSPCVNNVVFAKTPPPDKTTIAVGEYEFNSTACDFPNVPCDGACLQSCNKKMPTPSPTSSPSETPANNTNTSSSSTSNRTQSP